MSRVQAPQLRTESLVPLLVAIVGVPAAALAITRLDLAERSLPAIAAGLAFSGVYLVISLRRFATGAIALALLGPLALAFSTGRVVNDSTEVLLLLTSIAAASYLLRQPARLPAWIYLSAGAFGAGAWLAALANLNFGTAWGAARWSLAIVVILALAESLTRTDSLRTLQRAMVISGSACASLGVLQAVGFRTVVGAPYYFDRMDSTFRYYSNYASFLGTALVFCLFSAIDSGERRAWRLFSLCVAALISVQIVSTTSRGAVISVLVAGIFAVFWARHYLTRAISVIFVTAGSTVLLLAMSDVQQRARLLERFSTAQGEDIYRSSLQSAGLELAARQPLGIGFGEFAARISQDPTLGALAPLAHAHRLPTQIALEVGWVGFIGAMGLLILPLARSLRQFFSGAIDDLLAIGFLAATFAFWTQGWVDYFFFETANLTVFTVLSGATLALAFRARPAVKSAEKQLVPHR